MKGRKVVAMVLSSAIIVSGLGTVSLAESKKENVQMASDSNVDKQNAQKASNSNAENNQDTNRVEKEQEVNQVKNSNKEKASPSDAEVVVTSESELKTAFESGKNAITIEGNISLTDSLVISNGKHISLTGGKLSCGLDRPGNNSPNQMISVEEGAELTLSDIEIDATGWGNDKPVSDKTDRVRCYTIMVDSESEIAIEDGAQIYCEPEEMKGKVIKRGIFLKGKCIMNGGSISGFTDGGITVNDNAQFIMNGGEITENGNYQKQEGFLTAGAGIQGNGSIELNGGSITFNEYGAWILGNFTMNDGEISQNTYGVYNCNESSGIGYKPESIIKGGSVSNNETAITNLAGGTITITGDAVIEGKVSAKQSMRSFARSVSSDISCVIMNTDKAIFNLKGGSLISDNPNEIVVYNTDSGTFHMNGDGVIKAIGLAIRNENPTPGEFTLEKGTITAAKAFENVNQGYAKVTKDLKIEGSNQYLVAVTHSDGGKVSPSATMAEAGQIINFSIIPDSGYQISSVKVDGEDKGAVSKYSLEVTSGHEVIVEFAKKQSGGGSGSGGGSSASRKITSSTQNTVPETPGNWIQDATGWKFLNTAGSAYANTWVRKNSQWYWIGEDGYMKTGWNLINEKWYYLMPVSGEMKTGWIADNGSWYYTDESGVRVTGWVKSGDKWYYLNADGKMAFNTTTPDGYQVDENGVWC